MDEDYCITNDTYHFQKCREYAKRFDDFLYTYYGIDLISDIQRFDFQFRDTIYRLKKEGRMFDIRYELDIFFENILVMVPSIDIYAYYDAEEEIPDKPWFKSMCKLGNKKGDFMMEKNIFIPHHIPIDQNIDDRYISTISGFDIIDSIPRYRLESNDDVVHNDVSKVLIPTKYLCNVAEKDINGNHDITVLGTVFVKDT
jgi:hypothetical protein